MKAIGDIFIVNKGSLPSRDDSMEMPIDVSETAEPQFEGFN